MKAMFGTIYMSPPWLHARDEDWPGALGFHSSLYHWLELTLIWHMQGQWRRLSEHLQAFRSWSDFDDFMSNAAFYVLALTKLRQYSAAAEELTRIGDLDAPEHTEHSSSGALSDKWSFPLLQLVMTRHLQSSQSEQVSGLDSRLARARSHTSEDEDAAKTL